MKRVVDLSAVLKKVRAGWVAISSDYKKVMAKGRDFRTVNQKVSHLPRGSVVLMPVVKNPRYVVTLILE